LSLVTIVLLIISKVELAFLMLQHIALTALHSCADNSKVSLFLAHFQHLTSHFILQYGIAAYYEFMTT